MRKCNKCGESKEDSNFGASHPHCRMCKNKAEKERRARKIEEIRAYDRARYLFKRRKDKIAYCTRYNASNGTIAKRKNASYTRLAPSSENTRKILSLVEFQKITHEAEKRRTGFQSLVRKKLKTACVRFLKNGNLGKWSELLGGDWDFVRQKIEAQFTEGMNWDNHGEVWHIDHYVPVSYFDLDDPSQLAVALNWRNLRPLKAKENLIKFCSLPRDYLDVIAKIENEIDQEAVRKKLLTVG